MLTIIQNKNAGYNIGKEIGYHKNAPRPLFISCPTARFVMHNNGVFLRILTEIPRCL